jgi:mono/diheme cytochrome c family protein
MDITAMASTGTRRQRRGTCLLAGALALALAACSSNQAPVDARDQVQPSTMLPAPAPAVRPLSSEAGASVRRGQYLVELLGCGTCHTDGALVGRPRDDRSLAGSSIGIAYTNPLVEPLPGVVFPPNLTPDLDTGIGRWSAEDIAHFLRSGFDPDARRHLPVMPWPAYASLSDPDAKAIAYYLRSLAPVSHKVPANVAPGESTSADYVHFGIYQSE